MSIWRAVAFSVLALGAIGTTAARAIEHPIGQPVIVGGMKVAAVFLQPIKMDPPGVMRGPAESDIHLEADIHAVADNPSGFAEGDWMPYLVVRYELTRLDSGQRQQGELMPMVARDGPHYGDNVKLMGLGKYRLALTVAPPSASPHARFGRHTDKETGVARWFEPFTVEFQFTFAGTGKKGSY